MANEVALMEGQEELTEDELKELAEEANTDLEGNIFWLNVSIKGRQFTVEDIPGDKDTLYAVILGVTEVRKYYDKPFIEGEETSPICFSIDGITPIDNKNITKQSETCKDCPQAVFGSKITASGKEAPACSRAKRLVFTSIKKSIGMTGIIYRLNVPPTSIKNWNKYIQILSGIKKLPAAAVITAITFDQKVLTYPILNFEMRGILSKEIRSQVSELKNSEVVNKAVYDAFVADKSSTEAEHIEETVSKQDDDDVPF